MLAEKGWCFVLHGEGGTTLWVGHGTLGDAQCRGQAAGWWVEQDVAGTA